MTYEELASERHLAQKQGNTLAIKQAALELAEERGIGRFTVEELADRADISRRTFFNHFGSIQEAVKAGLRDIVLESSETVMVELLKGLDSEHQYSTEELFEIAANTLLAVDFTTSIRRTTAIIGVSQESRELQNAWLGDVLSAVLVDFEQLLVAKTPNITHLDRHLLVRVLLTSVEVAAEEWGLRSMGLPPEEGRQEWQKLHSNTIARLRIGFGANSSAK